MSHDSQAAYAVSEMARGFSDSLVDCFERPPPSKDYSVFASRETGRIWPISDGVINLHSASEKYELAVEFKRPNEGLHGILTALGQAHAYIEKGFSGSVIVIPRMYGGYPKPGEYLDRIIDRGAPQGRIAVFDYSDPDISLPRPFMGRLACVRPLRLTPAAAPRAKVASSSTQWAHVREGSTEPDALYRYLQTANEIDESEPVSYDIVPGLEAAARRLWSSRPIEQSLSYSEGSSLHDRVWQQFWFKWVLTKDVQMVWEVRSGGGYRVNRAPTRLNTWDGRKKIFFASRSDSPKQKIVRELNDGTIDERAAWEKFAENIRKRAHSYREDIDSGLDHMGLLESDGRPSETGSRYVVACQRSRDPNSAIPRTILASALLTEGDMLAFLHYVFHLSEEKFRKDPLAFSTKKAKFDDAGYLLWLRDKLANELHVLNTASLRGGVARRPFQAELATLRHLGLVADLRVGVGLEINWPAVQEVLQFTLV